MSTIPTVGLLRGTLATAPFSMPGSRQSTLAAVLTAAALIAAGLIVATGTSLELAGFARFAALAGALGLVFLWCQARSLDPRLAAAAGIVAVGTVSLMLCGIVSNLGLRMQAPLADAQLAAVDAAIGLHVDQAVQAAARSPVLIEVLAFTYNTSGLMVVALIFAAITRKALDCAWELTVTAVIAMQAVAAISVSMPAVGAMKHFGLGYLQGDGLPAGAGVYHLKSFAHFYSGTDPLVRLEDLNGLVTFPSFHTVLALLATQALWQTRFRWLGVAWTATVIVSTIPIGGHYLVDLIAGLLIWAGAAAFSSRLNNPSA
jgi:membrane-associated phospholipid phosphatase